MNLQLLQSTIATHPYEARWPGTWRTTQLIMIWIAASLLATAAFALDPQKSITQFVHTAWTEKDGAPANIRALTQTKDGFLWLGTQTGLFSFDGIRFARFKPPVGEDLAGAHIRMLLATRDGSLWIIFLSGSVSRILNGHVTSYSEREGLPATFALVECKDGSLIAGTARGLARFKDGIWKDVTREWNFPGKQAHLLYLDSAGTFWAVTEDRIVYLPPGQKQFVDPGEPILMAANAYNFAEAPDGSVWISETGRSAHNVRRLHDHSQMTEVQVGASWVLFDQNGSLWVSSIGDGLRRIVHPERFRGRQVSEFSQEAEQFTTKEGVSANFAYALFEDREGNIWSGSARGLDRFRESVFTPISIPQSDARRAILGTRDGGLWTSTNSQILHIAPDGNYEVAARYGSQSMCEDENGVPWFVLFPTQLARFQQGRFVIVIGSGHHLPGGADLKALQQVTLDGEGGIWLSDLEQGVFRLAGGVLTKFAAPSDPVYPWAALYKDRNGRIWVGQYNHVALYDHGKYRIFGTGDGVPPGPVFTIYHDRAGNVWAGGEGGLSKFENGRFRTLPKSNGLSAQSVFGMVEDDEGYWWLATDLGVLRIPAGELDRAVANAAYRIRYESFNTLDGLPGSPRDTFPMPVVTRTTDGRVWFATSNGIAYVDPRHIPRNDLPPPVHVETVKVDDKVLAPADGIVLAHNSKDIEIDYTALSLSIPERVLFRYKLEDYDTEWQKPGTRRQAFYNDLRPGKYKFRVIASNNDGIWNEEGATLDFSVAPAWYQTIWFRILCMAGIALLLWALYQLRLQQLQREFNMALEARVGERTRIARELHDTLLQSFHGLMFRFQAARNMLPRRPEQAMQALDGAISRTEQAIAEGREAIRDLRSGPVTQSDLAELLTAAGQELSAFTDAECDVPVLRVTVEGERKRLSPAVQEEVYWIARELLRNAFQHASAHKIEAEIRYEDHLFRLRIRDDGKGIDPKVLEAGGCAGHWGLAGVRERAQELEAQLNFWSETGVGTEVQLTVNAAVAYESSRSSAGFSFLRKAKIYEHTS